MKVNRRYQRRLVDKGRRMFKRRNKRVLKHVERATIEVYKATPGEPLELIQHKDMAYLWPAWLSKQAACRGRRCAFGGRR